MNRLFEADVIGALDVARGQETLAVNDAIAPRRVNTCKRLYNGCRSAEAILPNTRRPFPDYFTHVNGSALHNLSSSLLIGHEESILPPDVCGRAISRAFARAILYRFSLVLII